MSDAISIRVEGLWKHYGLSSRPGLGQIARAVLPQVCRGPMNGDAEFWALRDVSFQVKFTLGK